MSVLSRCGVVVGRTGRVLCPETRLYGIRSNDDANAPPSNSA